MGLWVARKPSLMSTRSAVREAKEVGRKAMHIYFHAPCFDGAVSCALAWALLEERGWEIEQLIPINYDVRKQWLKTSLPRSSAVVDFPYHPSAVFWVDHHNTTFLNTRAERSFQRRASADLVFDPRADSCAQLLWEYAGQDFRRKYRLLEPAVEWARIIDAARYRSVKQAVEGRAAALRINLSLTGADEQYTTTLVRLLREHSLSEVAALPEIKERVEKIRAKQKAGTALIKRCTHLTPDGLAVFNVSTNGVIVNRYAPYYAFPKARYSVGAVQTPGKTTITAMRNPWRHFQSVALGRIFEKVGGGGHERVGAAIIPPEKQHSVPGIINQLVKDIRQHENRASRAKSSKQKSAHAGDR